MVDRQAQRWGSGHFRVGCSYGAIGGRSWLAIYGLEVANSQTGSKDGYPAGAYFIFGSVALLFAAGDVRMLVRGGISGAQRIARHLWRMC